MPGLTAENGAPAQGESAAGLEVGQLAQLLPMLAQLPADTVQNAIQTAAAAPDMALEQTASVFTKSFYVQLGADTDAMQTNYILWRAWDAGLHRAAHRVRRRPGSALRAWARAWGATCAAMCSAASPTFNRRDGPLLHCQPDHPHHERRHQVQMFLVDGPAHDVLCAHHGHRRAGYGALEVRALAWMLRWRWS